MTQSIRKFSERKFGAAFIDALESRRLMSAAGALAVSLKVSNTSVSQSRPFTATVTVTNTSTQNLIGVLPSISQSAGDLLITKLATPSIASLAAGKSIVFKYGLEELIAGSATIVANAASPYGTSAGSASVSMTTLPPSPGKSAVTDSSGNASLKVSSSIVPVHFADQNTGIGIAGLTLSITSANRQNSHAVIAVADSQGRYPVQMVVLEGAGSAAATANVNLTAHSTATFSAGVGAVDTSSLPTPIVGASAGTIGDAYASALKAMANSKLPLPASFAGTGAPKVLYSSRPITVQNLGLQVASTAVKFGVVNTLGEAIIDTGVYTGPIADAAETAITGSDLSLALGNSVYQETNLQAVTFTLISAGGVPYFILKPVAPAGGAAITWTPANPMGNVIIGATNAAGQSITGGSYQLISNDDLGADIVGVLPASGSPAMPVELGNYHADIVVAGSQTFSNDPVNVPSTGTSLAPKLATTPIASGTLTSALGQPTGFLAAGTQYYLTPHFFDAKGNEVPVSGTGPYTVNGNPVTFYASNPVGATVAMVDPSTGLVTMGPGFGAALITAYCNGVTTTAKLVSTNGNGKYPLQPAHSFVINPTTLHFTAQEGGANPADQTYDIMPLSSAFQNYNYTIRNSWLSETPTNVNNYNIMDVSVDISGLTAGNYSLPLTITDSASHYSQSIIVSLTITPAPPVSFTSGTYVGNWTYPVFGFGDDYATLTLKLQRTGNKITGSWASVILDGSVDTTGDTNGDTFYTGSIVGNTITLVDHSETTFVGTISGNTITGTSNYLQATGSFMLTAQG